MTRTRQLKYEIARYLGKSAVSVSVFTHRGRIFVDVEYEDFLPYRTVERKITGMAGEGALVAIRRSNSDDRLMRIFSRLLYCLTGREDTPAGDRRERACLLMRRLECGLY